MAQIDLKIPEKLETQINERSVSERTLDFFAKRDDGKHLERKLAEAWTRQEMGGKRIEYFEPEIAMKAIDERETKLVGTGGLPRPEFKQFCDLKLGSQSPE